MHTIQSFLLCLFVLSVRCQQTEDTEEGQLEQLILRYPYIVNLRNGDQPVCSGTLIGRQSVITAAKCVDPRLGRDFLPTVWLNATDPREARENIVIREAVEVYHHPNYTGYISDGFDLAILRLNESVAMFRQLRIFTFEAREIPPGTRASSLFYGRSSFNSARAEFIQITSVEVLDTAYCRNEGFGFIKDQMLCVSSPLLCTGDQGGPVFRDLGDPFSETLYAVVSGTLCREESEVAGVTSVLANETVHWVRETQILSEQIEFPESSTPADDSTPSPEPDEDSDQVRSLDGL